MKRDPSLHIKYSDFKRIIGIILGIEDDAQLDGLTSEVFLRSAPHSINTRTVAVTNDRMEKKAKNLVKASRYDADLLAKLIYAKRKHLKHRGISLILPAGKDWEMVKQVAASALNFTNEFNLTRRYGFIKYIEIGLSKMQKFALNKYINMYEGICVTYQAMLDIEQDDDSTMTQEMYKVYAQRIIESTGMFDRLDELPDKYVWFVKARQQAEKLNISPKIYIQAQFAGLDFSGGIPHPTQLVGIKANERVVRFCYEQNIKIKK